MRTAPAVQQDQGWALTLDIKKKLIADIRWKHIFGLSRCFHVC
ncbi:hypothetical protein MTBPR1_50179 [Candidatus Terasakiella magnetica]|uniref:Uncharacterized protein n=1 Tax=Candidatus Terasakiella magnetica TaxID=1867952 RepID=A0A1C3RJL6_9PROT|nr:hypothetical protein MTBPR1_50179 [Candidatus Terasakiella magnetica]